MNAAGAPRPGGLPPLLAAGLALLHLPPAGAAELSGRVLGYPDGEPVVGAQVLAMDLRGNAAAGLTDADGAFLVEAVDGGRQRLRVRPDQRTDRVGAYWGDVYLFCQAPWVFVDPEERVEGFEILLPGGGGLEGVARDHDGTPLPGATVRARGLDPWNRATVRSAVTDDAGRYLLVGLDSFLEGGRPRAGLYSIELAVAGVPSAWYGGGWDPAGLEPVEAMRGETRSLDLELPARAEVSVRVLDAGGEPLAGAVVRAEVAGFGAVGQGTTDAAGRVSLRGLGGGAVRLRAEAEGARTTFWPDARSSAAAALVPLDPAQPAEAELVLPPGGAVRVRLDGEGAQGARVRVEAADGAELLSAPAPWGEARLAGLPVGEELRFVVEPAPDSDGRALSRELALDADEEAELGLTLPRGGRAEVDVFTRSGRALRGATVELLTLDGAVSAAATADGEGRATLRGLPPGPGLLRARYEPFCSTDPTWVPIHAPGTPDPEAAEPVESDPDAPLQLRLELPPDADRDGMDDVWELAWGLDPDRDDAAEDPDGDGLDNLLEYRRGGDPLGGAGAGCAAGPGALLLLPLLPPAGRRRRT